MLLAVGMTKANSSKLVLRGLGDPAFPLFGEAKHEPMRRQFLKLCARVRRVARDEAWPFIYAYSSRVARLYLNLSCLRTSQDEKKPISRTAEFERLTAWTTDRIVDEVVKQIRNSADQRVQGFCRDNLGISPTAPDRWHLCYEVDYFLWYQGGQKEQSIFGTRATEPWLIRDNSFVRS